MPELIEISSLTKRGVSLNIARGSFVAIER